MKGKLHVLAIEVKLWTREIWTREHRTALETLRFFLCLNERNISLVAFCAVI